MDSNLEDGRLPVGTGLPMNGAAKASPPSVGIPDAARTPGPWEAEVLPADAPLNAGPWVGRLADSRYSALSCGDTQDEAIANARLIAAAPELLDAALIALGLIESGRIYEQQCCSGQDCGCRGSTYADEAEHYLRAAISKAAPAIAIEAGTAETEGLSPQGESAGRNGIAPTSSALSDTEGR